MAPIALTPPAEQARELAYEQLPDASNMGTSRKIICFSDFDGTICMEDTGHILTNAYGCGPDKREILDAQIKSGERSFREVSDEMWGSLDVPFEDGFKALEEGLQLDQDFKQFHQFCRNNDIPFNVISAGLKPVLRRVLDHFLGEEQSSSIEIVANDAVIDAEGHAWKPIWRHNTDLGHDKALSIEEYKTQAKLESSDGTIPMIVFIGDGISDLAAAGQSDLLFARRGLALEEHCLKNKIDYVPYDTFADIQREVVRVAKLDQVKTKGQGLPVKFNPRANLWRRISSKNAVPIFKAMTPSVEERAFLWPETLTERVEPLTGSVGKVSA
ncbi:probable 2,3-diketo-5-methylthio-1-phosphopentane phosphatase, putative [Ramularia collo-cygni]|uniref:Probable 2,3-diketo-5-methylthio-1-phosphopentane phosphatase, putative n=1 Tax=Ramularia collo-cygni TaxID=112498 RepID=A0A2D3V161_9PEZI|nr:probable 2,3-diketo-5-methylthio-1-phosphopentane phosphatase, putative [Ramularia collo-cygni]CZT19220.1 probable 2,3-diketo-5-methylthio-1-phosphopentane phosphatase, putative [Ramularia collo-cygni]